MSQPIIKFIQPPSLTSPFLLAPPDVVPPVDDLERAEADLKVFKQRSLERAKKADDDLKTIEAAMRKMRELEKGKAKALAKVKREASHTPGLDNDELPSPSAHGSTNMNGHINNGNMLTSNSAVLPRNVSNSKIIKKKDKDKERKRKREADESEGEPDSQRPRKFSPVPSTSKEAHHYKPSKLSNIANVSKSSMGIDWTLPPIDPLLQPRPPIPPPMSPTPRRPIDVTEDFTKVKAVAQAVPVTTFYSSIEPWLRAIKEEDIGWLEFTADETEPYVMPKPGRHYTEIWEDEDIASYGGVPATLDFSASRNGALVKSSGLSSLRWDASVISDVDLVSDKGLGPLTERVVSALLSDPEQSSVKRARDNEDVQEMGGMSLNSNGLSLKKEIAIVADIEERIKDSARFYGILDSEPDFVDAGDDPISTALRQAQRQLRAVIETNKARKSRLAQVARDRLAYQEYVEVRESIDKNIATTYTKLQKRDVPKMNKKKKKVEVSGKSNGMNGIATSSQPLPNPASLGLGPSDDGHLIVPEALKVLVETRREWRDVVGGAFDERERLLPGSTRGMPERSVFEGVDEEVRQLLQVRSGVQLNLEDLRDGSPLSNGQ